MQCPVDHTNLLMSERNGVEIDYCPQCRGVWLDRGELDKIIAATAGASGMMQQAPSGQSMPVQQPSRPQYQDDDHHDSHHDDHNNYGQKKQKRENFLGDLFDF